MAMMAITTSSSINVNAALEDFLVLVLENKSANRGRVRERRDGSCAGGTSKIWTRIGAMNHPLTRPPATLSPLGEREGVRGWFMESEHLQKLDVSWGHEPFRPRARPRPRSQSSQSRTRTRTTTTKGRFMGSFDDFEIVHRNHDPLFGTTFCCICNKKLYVDTFKNCT